MSTIGFTTLLNQVESPLSPHFGKAKWLMILDTSTNAAEFVGNAGLIGRSMVDLLQAHHCDEAVFSNIGPGALRQLKKAGIAGWFAPSDVAVSQVSKMLFRGQLRPARKPTPGGEGTPRGLPTRGDACGTRTDGIDSHKEYS